MINLKEALNAAAKELSTAGLANSRRDVELLMLHVLGIDRAALIVYQERTLTCEQRDKFEQLIARRKQSEPIQYITGRREFYGLTFTVTPDVLIPRPETEHLVEAALERIPLNQPYRIADIGTGSGAIAIAIAIARPFVRITAADISPAALAIAKQNAATHKVADRIQFSESNLLEAIEQEHFDMIVSNPPYIANSDRETLAAEVRDYEPATALFAGPTGLEIYERLVPQALQQLRHGGWLLLEMGAGQQSQLRQLTTDWDNVSFVDDLQGIPRVAIAQRP